MSAVTLSPVLIGTCLAVGLIGTALWRVRSPLGRMTGAGLGALCCALAWLTWLLRWREAGHLPLFGTYESGLSLATSLLSAAVVAELVLRRPGGVTPVAAVVAAVLGLHAARFDATVYALTISERSWVVELHAVLAWCTFAMLGVNLALSVRQLQRRRDAPPLPGLVGSLHWGFVLHSGMMASGALYKFLLFGKVWSFDPMESMGLVVWLCYGALLHLRYLGGWPARRLAGWSLSLFILLALSYRLVVHFPAWSSYHILDMDLRMHIGS